jgi:hypothetical protein
MAPVVNTFEMAQTVWAWTESSMAMLTMGERLASGVFEKRTRLTYKGRVLGLFSFEEMTVSNFIL